MRNYVLYIHTNKVNGKKYVGITNNPNVRFSGNGTQYKASKKFFAAIQKYGWDNFENEIVLTDLTFEEACKKEIEYIAKLKTQEIGYNLSPGGNGGVVYKVHPRGMLGKTHTPEERKRISERTKGKNNPFYGKKHEIHPRGMLGKTHTEEKKKQISKTVNAKKPSAKHVRVFYPNGTEVFYVSAKTAMEDMGIGSTLFYQLLKGSYQPNYSHLPKRKWDFYKKFEGIRAEYFKIR